MQRLNVHHMDIPYDVVECEDKVVVLNIPSDIDDRKYKAIKAIMHYIKDNCGAKEVITIPDIIDFKSMEVNDAINLINDHINSLHAIKEEILLDEEYN